MCGCYIMAGFSAAAWKCAARRLNRVGFSPSIRSHAPDRQQQPLSDPARTALPEPRLARAGLVRATAGSGPARALRLPAAVAGDVRRSAVLPRHRLPRRQLVLCRRRSRLSPHPGGLWRRPDAAKRVLVRPLRAVFPHSCRTNNHGIGMTPILPLYPVLATPPGYQPVKVPSAVPPSAGQTPGGLLKNSRNLLFPSFLAMWLDDCLSLDAT